MNIRIYKQRIYEGEWLFVCRDPCKGFFVEYAFNDYEDTASQFLSNHTGGHAIERCHLCGGLLEWAGYAGDMPVTKEFLSLVNQRSFMASTVILAATTENFISNLVYAAFVDRGLSREHANKVASRRMTRHDALECCRCLLDWRIPDLAFPVRNLVAHGRGFGEAESKYCDEMLNQVRLIEMWVQSILDSVGNPYPFMPKEADRWLLFMRHWSAWLAPHLEFILTRAEQGTT